jgi:hypothetical protein
MGALGLLERGLGGRRAAVGSLARGGDEGAGGRGGLGVVESLFPDK